ncbi:uncharacterized protein PAC_01011 [Phialocephala subalpina]|uniref:BTB domain-containing protein n=1 Tax=Phialocephala subalpina TaxID=576137 RepID=A0A1L7WEE0_9HELO|nr:uncharacterized protein PAC_01011 [Phialocephala subalpina]
MSDSTPKVNPASDAENLNSPQVSSSEVDTEHVAKKQKRSLPTFSNPASMVKLLVGKGKKSAEFILHKEVACKHSPVLKKLPHVEKDTARLLLQYLYTNELVVKGLGEGQLREEACDKETYGLVKLWLLAEELQIPRLQNKALEVVDEISAKTKYITTGSIPTIYNKTKEGSFLRRYMVSACYYSLEGQMYKNFKEHFPSEMLLDLAVFVSVDSQHSREGGEWDLSDFFVAVEGE